MKSKQNKPIGETTFYSTRGIIILVVAVLIFAAIALVCMYMIGVIKLPGFISNHFTGETIPPSNAENIAPLESEAVYKALPAGEYAIALADMPIPSEYYLNYNITLSSEDNKNSTDYIAIKKGNDWWVQTSRDEVILTTAICKNDVITITDNASNSSVTDTSKIGTTFKERCGIMPLSELVEMIRAVECGENIAYGGGITTYSLSFTQARITGDNLFNFSFTCENGISEEYIFAFESAAILSAKKILNGKTIYQMELYDSRSDLSEIDTDALFTIE
ncbi:MAG: hypothetical protein IJA60_00105 [Clostridia bacterium]|nr:hypothetical protein [Clostridia bacterium]